MEYGWFFAFLYVITMFLMCFGIFNVIMAIYVENIVAAAKFDLARKRQLRLKDKEAHDAKLKELLQLIANKYREYRSRIK